MPKSLQDPTKPRSEAQKAAARRNGAKSKGPVTAMGKKISSRNALRHGLEASDISLTSENPEAFSQVLSEYMDEYRPVGPTETTLVEHLAIAHFRLYRAWTSETALYNIEMAENDERLTKKYTYMAHPVRTADATETMLARSNALPHVYRCQAAVNREYYRALNKLLDLRKPPKAPRKTASKTPEIAETNPDISVETQQSQAPGPMQPEEQGHREETTGAQRTPADRHPQLAGVLSVVAALILTIGALALITIWNTNHSMQAGTHPVPAADANKTMLDLRQPLRAPREAAARTSEIAERNPAISLETKETEPRLSWKPGEQGQRKETPGLRGQEVDRTRPALLIPREGAPLAERLRHRLSEMKGVMEDAEREFRLRAGPGGHVMVASDI
jgi:hypothetical protein